MFAACINTSQTVTKSSDSTFLELNVSTKNISWFPFCFDASVIAFAAVYRDFTSAKPGVSK